MTDPNFTESIDHEDNPQIFGDFNLTESSQSCIDKGIPFIIEYEDTFHGFTVSEDDYNGLNPDMGAFESDFEISGCGSGDVLEDSSVDVLDVVAIVGHILQTQVLTSDQVYEGDLTCDGGLDVLDVVAIVALILGG